MFFTCLHESSDALQMKVLENLKQVEYIQNPHEQKDEKAGPQ